MLVQVSPLKSSHISAPGLPGMPGAVRAHRTVVCILWVGQVRLREVKGQSWSWNVSSNSRPSAWPTHATKAHLSCGLSSYRWGNGGSQRCTHLPGSSRWQSCNSSPRPLSQSTQNRTSQHFGAGPGTFGPHLGVEVFEHSLEGLCSEIQWLCMQRPGLVGWAALLTEEAWVPLEVVGEGWGGQEESGPGGMELEFEPRTAIKPRALSHR